MTEIEKKIEELKKEEQKLINKSRYDTVAKKELELKKLEGTVGGWIIKTSKTCRSCELIYHIKYELKIDSWKREDEEDYYYIAQTYDKITFYENLGSTVKQYSFNIEHITPKSYNGKMRMHEILNPPYRYFSTDLPNLTVDIFKSIWDLCKVSTSNVLDGILDVKDIPWVMNGTREDRIYTSEDLKDVVIDIPHCLLTTEESWKLDNNFCRLFLNNNIYMITPNSLKCLDKWLEYERKYDTFAYSACASVGERWRGSRIEEYTQLVNKIKNEQIIKY